MWIDVEQNTEAWDLLRVGKVTSSSLACVMANYGKAFGEPAKKYATQIALGQITGEPSKNNYQNAHMERGNLEEPIARAMYEERYLVSVGNGGFYDLGDVGCSPDGLVGDDGVIEIKSAINTIHFDRVAKQSYDASYKWQLAGNLKFSGRDWIDFISYCADYPEDKQLYVYRCFADDFRDEFKMIDTRLDEFRELIAVAKHTILNNNYSIIRRPT
jgi:hypothetical protein